MRIKLLRSRNVDPNPVIGKVLSVSGGNIVVDGCPHAMREGWDTINDLVVGDTVKAVYGKRPWGLGWSVTEIVKGKVLQ